jgi:hypothetical protein
MANRRYRPRGIQRTSFHKWADQNNVTIYRDKEGNVIRTVKTKECTLCYGQYIPRWTVAKTRYVCKLSTGFHDRNVVRSFPSAKHG